MTGKDWITLLIPILCNGIIVFIFSKLIEADKGKKQKANEAYKKMLLELKGIVEEIFPIFYCKDKRKLLISVNDKMQEFISFFRKNETLLPQYKSTANMLLDTWNKLVDILHYSQDHEGGIISEQSSRKISPLIAELNDELIILASQYNKDLYNRGMYS